MSKDAIPTNDNQEDCIKSPWFKSKTVVPHNLPKSIDYKFAWNETGLLEVDGEEPALEEPKEQNIYNAYRQGEINEKRILEKSIV